jgi:hypothetical protein
MNGPGKSPKSNFSPKELSVLQCLREKSGTVQDLITIEINEISSGSGIRDSEEVLRALYTLEGRSLVEPDPPGDFTSARWRITDLGRRAADLMLN